VPDALKIPYAARARNKTKTKWIEIKIDHMTAAEALYWDRTIQLDIVAEALKARSEGKPVPRADRYWSWTGLRILFPLAQSLRKRRCRALSILVENASGQGVPAGMLLLIEAYPWPFPLGAASPQSTFLWFLASAPTDSLKKLGVVDPPSLGRILIDTALVTSMGLGHEGQMWLHAAPSGGEKLLGFYVDMCRLRKMQVGTALPSGAASDGRHCLAASVLAKRLIAELNLTR
jgi:hypothetical protein